MVLEPIPPNPNRIGIRNYREDKPNVNRRASLTSLRHRGRTTKRMIYEEDENFTNTDTGTIREKAPDMVRTSILSSSMRLIFRDLVNDSSTALEVQKSVRPPTKNIRLSLTGNDDETQTNDTKYLKTYIKNVINTEFPESSNTPTARDVINIGNIGSNKARYRPGSWVEIEGIDMKWRLDMITRVVRQAPEDFDWNDSENEGIDPEWEFYYHAGIERKFREEDVRSPEEGLKRVFGNRPWVWQQWAMLKLEEKIRFQAGHQYDCMEIDVQKYAADLWDQWLDQEDNAEFCQLFDDERVGNYGRSELRNHIMKPFYLIDRIKEDMTEWNFSDDTNISVFTYMSLLGAGSLIPFAVFVIQIAIPVLLVYDASTVEGCDDYNTQSRVMALIILTLYIVTVIPDNYSRLYEVEGAADTVYSRLLSLRRELWKQGDDSYVQMIGFKIDVIMSTGYECMLSILNIYVIVNTFSTIEVVLNALAFVFIAEIDQLIVKSAWWDDKNRWITAGTIEVIMATVLRFKWLESPSSFERHFGIPEHVLISACDGDVSLFLNPTVAKQDALNPDYLTKEERILHLFKEVSTEMNNKYAMDEYEKPKTYFGVFGPLMGRLGHANPVFTSFKGYRTWSRWNQILFLAQVPNLDDLFDVDDESGNMFLSQDLDLIRPNKLRPFVNFYPEDEGLSKSAILIRNMRQGLVDDLLQGFKKSMRHGKKYAWFHMPFLLLDTFLQLLSFFFQMILPLSLLFGFVLIFYQLSIGECITVREFFSRYTDSHKSA